MTDDLAAFFAKKAQKSKEKKKKGLLSLDEIAQQLERKAKIQEQGDFEEEGQKERDSSERENRIKSIPNNEDSEWLEFSEKPSLGEFTFKEFTEHQDEEIEEEKKNANIEANKTWNLEKKDVVEEETIVHKPVQKSVYQPPSKYQPPGQTRKAAALDINNEEMFPSIGMADKIEEKIKAEEKKKVPAAAVKPEDQFETKSGPARYEPPRGGGGTPRHTPEDAGYAPRPDRYEPPRPSVASSRYESARSTYNQQDSPRPGSGFGINSRRINEPAEDTPSQSETVSNWRTATKPNRNESSTYGSNTVPPQLGADKSSAFESNNWRTERRPAPPTQAFPQHQPASQTSAPEPKKGAYVPPSMRNRTQV